MAIFPIRLGVGGIAWDTPTGFLANLGAIMAICDHFWAIVGRKKKELAFFAGKSPKARKIWRVRAFARAGELYATQPRGGGGVARAWRGD